jgi:predicted acetyltransferase
MSDDNAETLELVTPTPALAEAYLDACREEVAHDARASEVVPTTIDGLRPLFQRWERQERTGDEATGGVPQSTFWLVRNGCEVLGSSTLRHRLTPQQRATVGHVDYGLRPSARRKGYGTRLLALTLARARLMGLDEVLVTCRKANTGSVRVIERNGGVLLGEYPRASDGEPMLRYSVKV